MDIHVLSRPLAKMEPKAALASDACWIWASNVDFPNSYVEFLRELNLSSRPDTAHIQVSAETSLRFWINGILVYSGPPREIAPFFYFDTLDIAPFLHPGANELRIIAHHQGENSASYQKGTPAILLAGGCTLDGAEIATFSTAAQWRVRPLPRYQVGAPRLGPCIGFSEHINFNIPEAPWSFALEVARHPWAERPKPLARDFPALKEIIQRPVSIQTNEEETLVDFGREVSGFVELNLQSKGHAEVQIAYAEALENERVTPRKGGLFYADRIEWAGEKLSWRSYEKRAFRYLEIKGSACLLEAKVAEQTYPYVFQFRQSPHYHRNLRSQAGKLVNRILETSARTLALNSEDLLTDCPWRERAQYFDCYFFAGALRCLFGTVAPIRRFLNQYSRGADQTGLLRMSYPSPGNTLIIPDFSMAYAVLLWHYLEWSGDMETVQKNLPFAKRGITAFRKYEDGNGLLTNVPGWIFLDNTFELPKFPRSAALNAVYSGGFRALAALCKACGNKTEAMKFEAASQRVRTAFRNVFLQNGRLLDSDSTPKHEAYRHWVFHHASTAGGTGSFRLCVRYRLKNPHSHLRLAVHTRGRAWIDAVPAADITDGGGWRQSCIYQPVPLAPPGDTAWHQLDLEVEANPIDWECYLSCQDNVEWSPAEVWDETTYGVFPAPTIPSHSIQTALQPHRLPWMTQTTVGYAAYHGLLKPEEARRLLRECLPPTYPFSVQRRATPFFGTIDPQFNGHRILPCNVPASLFHFCHALRRYGMEDEARKYLLMIYGGMIERGASTWWEEWNNRSSLCHAWGSFAAEFFVE